MQDEFPTPTSILQSEIESEILNHLSRHSSKFLRNKHLNYLADPIQNGLNHWFVALDASKPWILYWIFHSLDLLGKEIPTEVRRQAIETLEICKNATGGYGGGKDQISHLATTYAAVNTLAILGDYSTIDTKKIYEFLMRMKQKDGSFRMHVGGEIDIRGSYCALSVAILLNIMTPELVDGVAEFIVLCQSFEGGLGPIPGVEAHGGYTFCGLAAMGLLRKTALLDEEALIYWIANRQMKVEGGFQGRTNKLVDGCYSFWQAGSAIIMELITSSRIDLINKEKLFRYVYGCCQSSSGGLRDKPSKSPDFYHTCYCLSGLSICQYKYSDDGLVISADVIDPAANNLEPTHPFHNIGIRHVQSIKSNFYKV